MHCANLILCERRPLLQRDSGVTRCGAAEDSRPSYIGEMVSRKCIQEKEFAR